MAYSYASYTGTGSSQDIVVPFDFVSQDDVFVYVNGASVSFEWIAAGTVRLTAANGAAITVRRQTGLSTPAVEFNAASTLTAANIETANKQAFYAAQEAYDKASELVESLSGSDPNLPAAGSDPAFVVNVGGSWLSRSTAQVQSILGIDNAIPAAALSRFLATTTGGGAAYELITAATLKTRLALVKADISDLSLGTAAALNTGTTSGSIPLLTTGGELPAVGGANLTGVLHSFKGARFEHQTAAGVNPGVFQTGNTGGTLESGAAADFVEDAWNRRRMTHSVYNTDASNITLDTTDHYINLKRGLYLVDITASFGLKTGISSGLRIGTSLRLYNVTDSAEALVSTNTIRPNTPYVFLDDRIFGFLDLTALVGSASKNFAVQHWCEDNGGAEVYPGYSVNGLTTNRHMVVNIIRIA